LVGGEMTCNRERHREVQGLSHASHTLRLVFF